MTTKAYLVFEMAEVSDASSYKRYQDVAAPLLKEYGGKVLASKSPPRPLEGDWKPFSLYVIEFESEQRALGFYNDVEYQKVLPFRFAAAKCRAVFLEGIPIA